MSSRRGLTRPWVSTLNRPARSGRRRTRASAVRVLAALAVAGATLGATLPTAHASAQGPTNITLTPSLASPQPVGTRVTWTASATDINQLVYQFGISMRASGPFTVVRDFSAKTSFTTAPLIEGTVYISVTVAEGYGSPVRASKEAAYTYSARVVGSKPVVNTTANPLVALYSAPPCKSGMEYAAFRQVGGTTWHGTNMQACIAGRNHNFLVAGMLPSTSYNIVSVVVTGTVMRTSAPVTFTTGSIQSGVTLPTFSVLTPLGAGADTAADTIPHLLPPTLPATEGNPVATDLSGNVIWYVYSPDLSATWPLRQVQIPGPAGEEVYLTGNDGQVTVGDNVLRTVDLAGDPLQETSVAAVNAQLAAMGDEPIYGFHHDALRLPNGDTAVLGFTTQTITTTPVLGDMLLVLDSNFQVKWVWDGFKQLDTSRGPILGDTCAPDPQVICPIPGYPNAIDWTHANALDYTPSDHNFVISLRNQAWVIKVNYDGGLGNGHVIWHMGPGGDFKIIPLNPSDPYPWFSYQHNPNFVNGNTMVVFDNGNVRCNGAPAGTCDSRGQEYQVNESARVVTQTVNQDVGGYGFAQGTAQRLGDGNFNWGLSFDFNPPPPYSQAEEFSPSGTKEFALKDSVTEYRAWRLTSLYAPTNPACPSC